jgi:hypothetical protein
MIRLETEPQRLEHSLQFDLDLEDTAAAEKMVPWTYALLRICGKNYHLKDRRGAGGDVMIFTILSEVLEKMGAFDSKL